MSLSKKLFGIMAIFALLAMAIVSLILIYSSSKSYYKVEEMSFIDKLVSLESTIEKEFEDLEYILTDWGEWDATYAFVQGERPDYIEDNLGEDILDDLNLDFFYILSEKNDVLYGMHRDSETGEQTALDPKTLSVFIKQESTTGALLLDRKIVFLASMAVTNNEATAKPLGSIGFGRCLSDEKVQSFESSTNLTLKIDINADNPSQIHSYVQGSFNIMGELIHASDEDSVINIRIPLLNNDNQLVIHTVLRNTIQELGVQYMRSTSITLFVVLAVLGLALHMTYKKMVFSRLVDVNEQIMQVIETGDSHERLPCDSDDEIGDLNKNINALLEVIDRKHQEAEYYATFDDMTGVYNRRVGLDILEETIRNAYENDVPFSIVFMDIDGLKNVNDHFGHKMGDQLIEDAVRIVKNTGIKSKIVVRLGGDEFLVILKHSDKIAAELYEEQLKRAIHTFNEKSDKIYTLSMSSGSVEFTENMTLSSMLDMADQKMYREKNS